MTTQLPSKERLEKIASWRETYGAGHNVMLPAEEAEAMARALLAAHEQEPVAWWTGPEPTPTGEIESIHDHETGSHSIPLYPHHAPIPAAVPDELLSSMEEVLRISDRDHDAWNRAKSAIAACRAAKPQSEPAGRDYLAIVERIAEIMHGSVTDVDLLTVTVLSMKQKAEHASLPGGYALVPVEPTEEMMLHKSGCQHHAWDDPDCPMRETRRLVWRYMLTAAPKEV
ncbi:hypothetical protein [Phytobacter sp. V91]|uniref:hypothetical protein n=1 Tax=Phytobacter sp. V91 TaxID=3369425 RepID=UPI003F5E829A